VPREIVVIIDRSVIIPAMTELIAQSLLQALNSNSSQESSHLTLERNELPSSSIGQNLKKWNDDLESELLRGDFSTKKFEDGKPSFVSSAIKKSADTLHSLILNAVDPTIVSDAGGGTTECESDEEAERSSWAVATSTAGDLVVGMPCGTLSLLAELLRAAGLFMRWFGQVIQPSFESSDANDNHFSNNPTTRLKCRGMLLLYCKILEMETPTIESPDIPRFSSICLFRATYGNDDLTVSARKTVVESIDGCVFLVNALTKRDQPIPRLFSVLRNVHHLVSTVPASAALMDKAIDSLNEKTSSNDGEFESKYGLVEVLVDNLTWTVQSLPPFPGDKSDRRSEMALEILRSLFAVDVRRASKYLPSNDTMTKIGVILCDLLKLPNVDDRVHQCKLAVVALLLNAPEEYSGYLLANGGIIPLIDIMKYQASAIIARKRSRPDDAASIVPIMLVLGKLAQANETVLKMIRDEVFPLDAEKAFEEMAFAEVTKKKSEGKVKAKNMAPLDAPIGTLRWKLIRLMTWTESNVKRSVCELLWTLCGQDSTQFILRTGFGNAIHFLGIKGIVNLPAGVDT